MMKTAWLTLIGATLSMAPAQSENTPFASLVINGFSRGPAPIRATADRCSGLQFAISSGPNGSQPFALGLGPLQPGMVSFGAQGSLDINIFSPSFWMLADGLYGGLLGGDPVYNALANTGTTPTLLLPLGLQPGGPLGGVQALVADPTLPGGSRFTAVTELEFLTSPLTTNLTVAANSAASVPLPFSVSVFGVVSNTIHVHENGVIALPRPGSSAPLAETAAAFGAGLASPITVLATPLGVTLPVGPNIGFFEDLQSAASGGSGTISVVVGTSVVHVTWCGAAIVGGGSPSSFTVSLHGTQSATPGQIETVVRGASAVTTGNGRVFGISPGGNGVTSVSPLLTGLNLSAMGSNVNVGGTNAGFVGGPLEAILESFNATWPQDPVNPTCDLVNRIVRYDPLPNGGYQMRVLGEEPLALTGVSPNASVLAGGGPITISGRGFRNDGTVSVTLGGVPVQGLAYVDSETLTGTIPPAAAPGPVAVSATVGSTGASTFLASLFTYGSNSLSATLGFTDLDEGRVTWTFSPSVFGSFPLYGGSFTQIHVFANGFVELGASPGNSDFVSSPATFNARGNITIAPLFNDLCADPTCGIPAGSVQVLEEPTRFRVTWTGFYQWPSANGPFVFSLTLDKATFGSNAVVMNWASSAAVPNPTYSQGPSGIVVGMKGPGSSGAAPVNLLSLAGPGLGFPGPNLGVAQSASVFHWIPSPGYTGGVPYSGPGLIPGWNFGSAVAPGPAGNRTLALVSTGAPHNNFFVVLN